MKKMPADCRHAPPCPVGTTRWRCGKRSEVEAAVSQGTISRDSGKHLLLVYGLPMTAVSRVYAGEPVRSRQERLIP